MPASLLETTLNIRDLGGYPTANGRLTRCSRILRSNQQGRPSEQDVCFLVSLGVTTLIDLRTEAETQRTPSGFAGLEGFTLTHRPIAEDSGVPASPDEMPTSDLHIVQATQLSVVFRAIAQAEGGVLYACTSGMDRTGVVTDILLLLCGVPDACIIDGCMLTRTCDQSGFEQDHRPSSDQDMRVVTPQSLATRAFLHMFRNNWESADAYLLALGLTDSEIARLRAKLLD